MTMPTVTHYRWANRQNTRSTVHRRAHVNAEERWKIPVSNFILGGTLRMTSPHRYHQVVPSLRPLSTLKNDVHTFLGDQGST